MKEMFSFQNFPMAILVALVAGSYLVFISVLLLGD